jgi:hypothetical protein
MLAEPEGLRILAPFFLKKKSPHTWAPFCLFYFILYLDKKINKKN